jgi:hypothetical protein
MNNLYNQLTKTAMPKFLTDLGSKIKGNKYVDAFSPRKSSTWKANDYGMTEGTNAAARKALRTKAYKTTAGVAGVGAVGYGGYALGQKKQASYYELGHMLLEKDAGPKIDNVKKSLSSFWRNKIKHNYNSGKTYIKGKGDKWFGTAKDGKTRFDKGVSGVRKARPYVVGGAAGIGGTALYNKYKNRDQE